MDLMKWEEQAPRDLWDAFDSLRGEMEDAMSFFRMPNAAGLLDRNSAPPIDLIETNDDFIVLADLPGVKKEDLELSVAGSLLSIRGDKKAELKDDKRKIFRKETWVGTFSRTIDLPSPVDADKVQAELKNGVLSVVVPKREEAKARLVSVTGE